MADNKIIMQSKVYGKVDYFLSELPQVLYTEDGEEITFGGHKGTWGYIYKGCMIKGHSEGYEFGPKRVVEFLKKWIEDNKITNNDDGQ